MSELLSSPSVSLAAAIFPWRGRIMVNVDTSNTHHFCAMVIDALGS